ncbi:MAG: DCC1-like thiol-disulfide oxidoreductase family protein, partial [Candidatus Kapabacteria bacterium]|nr:DCC1-like thiol-disulfide oxidoreductase family protein [Candidatus Kapabacteria bacterium]MDW8224590.1 DCC1-like thiol-disulfide oxidoreductase family protein [Bacteroidota bacterium]
RVEAVKAVCLLLRLLGGWMRMIAWILEHVPEPVSHAWYRWIARYRYRLFGRSECAVTRRENAAVE